MPSYTKLFPEQCAPEPGPALPRVPAPPRHQVTIRLDLRDKQTFFEAAEAVGLEPGTAARSVLELICQRMRAGSDLLDVMQLLKQKPVVRVQAGKSP